MMMFGAQKLERREAKAGTAVAANSILYTAAECSCVQYLEMCIGRDKLLPEHVLRILHFTVVI